MKIKITLVLIYVLFSISGKSQNRIEGAWCVKEINQKNSWENLNTIYTNANLRFEKNNKLTIIREKKEYKGTYSLKENILQMYFIVEDQGVMQNIDAAFDIEFLNKKAIILLSKTGKDRSSLKLFRIKH